MDVFERFTSVDLGVLASRNETALTYRAALQRSRRLTDKNERGKALVLCPVSGIKAHSFRLG